MHRAPERRVDNLITRVHDSASMLRIHALVTEEARAEFAALRWRCYAATAALGASGPAAAALGFLYADLAPAAAGGVGVAGAVAGVLAVVRSSMLLGEAQRHTLSDAGMDECFERCHALEVAEHDEFTLALWWRVRPQLQTALRTLGLEHVERLSKADTDALDKVLRVEVPELRRLAAPVWQAAKAKGPHHPPTLLMHKDNRG